MSRYNLHRSTTPGLHAERGEPDRAADRNELLGHRSLARPRTTTASPREDAAGNVSTASNEASADRHRRHRSPLDAVQPQRDRIAQLRRAQLARLDGQRRRHALQPAPRDDCRIHSERGQPDRAADRDIVQRHRARRRHLLLPRHGRGRRRQRQRALERGQCRRDRRHAGSDDSRQPRGDRRRSARSRSPGRRRPTTSP